MEVEEDLVLRDLLWQDRTEIGCAFDVKSNNRNIDNV